MRMNKFTLNNSHSSSCQNLKQLAESAENASIGEVSGSIVEEDL